MAARRVIQTVAVATCLLQTIVFSKEHNDIIENLLSFGETDLAVFTDRQDITESLDFKQLERSFKIFNVIDLWQEQKVTPCPSEESKEDLYIHEPFYSKTLSPRHHTIVVHVKEVTKVLDVFDKTVLNCTFIIEPGIYNLENRFLFLAYPDDNLSQYAEKIFNSSAHIANHR